MKDSSFELQEGTLNSIYDRVINCRTIKPTHKLNTVSGSDFMLDKRLGLTSLHSLVGQSYYDYLDVEKNRFYYGKDLISGQGKIFNKYYQEVGSKNLRIDNPIKLKKGRGAGGYLILDARNTTNNLSPNPNPIDPQQEQTDAYLTANGGEGLITLNVPGHGWTATTSRYITFTSGILKGDTNKILYASGNTVYIHGTNVYGSLPNDNDKYMIFSHARDTILMGSDDGLTVFSITDSNQNYQHYYNLVFTYITGYPIQNICVLEIDGTRIFLQTSNDDDTKLKLETALGAGYVVEIVDGLLFIAKTDGSQIIFSKPNSLLKIQCRFLGDGTVIPTPQLILNLGGTEYTYDASSYITSGNTTFRGYFSSYPYFHFYSTNFFNSQVIPNLPAGYSGIVMNGHGKSVLGFLTSGIHKQSTTDSYLLIWKDDLTPNFGSAYYKTGGQNSAGVDVLGAPNYLNYRSAYNGSNQYYVGDLVEDGASNQFMYVCIQDCKGISVTDPSYWAESFEKWQTNIIESEWYGMSTSIINTNTTNIYSYESLHGEIINGKQDLNIIDIVEFNGAIFALTNKYIYFSRVTFDDNTHFYALDRLEYKGGNKLIPFGQSLIVIGDQNKLINKTSVKLLGTDNVTGYVMKDLEYNGNMFSKYSYKYTEGTLYLLQDDHRLMTIQVTPGGSTNYRVQSNEISKAYRHLFDNIQGECYVEQNGKYLNFLFVRPDNTTENYKFDISLQHWVINQYNKQIYRIGDEVLTGANNASDTGYIAKEEGYKDFGTDYSQEINFSIGNLKNITKVDILRTIFGLTKTDRLNLELILDWEEDSGNRQSKIFKLNNYHFDTQLDPAPDGDVLIGLENQQMYDGNIASIQTDIQCAGRFLRFKYKSNTRFIMGNNYMLHQESKPYVNDILTSN